MELLSALGLGRDRKSDEPFQPFVLRLHEHTADVAAVNWWMASDASTGKYVVMPFQSGEVVVMPIVLPERIAGRLFARMRDAFELR